MIELFDKEMTSEKSVTLDGRKDRPYHVVGEENKFAVTWGPFSEQKKLQVALYRTVPSGNEIEPIDIIQEVCSASLGCSQLIKHSLPVHI